MREIKVYVRYISFVFFTIGLNLSCFLFEIILFLIGMIYSLVLGNVYVFVAFKGVKVITHAERTQLFIILSSLCAAGMILLIFLRTVKAPYERLDDLQAAENS